MRIWAVVFLAQALLGQTPSTETIRSAATRSIRLLQTSSARFTKIQDCFSCHHNGLPTLALAVARERGIPVDEESARASLVKGVTHNLRLNSIDYVVQANMVIDPPLSEGLGLVAAHSAGVQPSLTTAYEARLIAAMQRDPGNWVTIDTRPPQSASVFTATATAARAVQFYMPPELQDEARACIKRAQTWLSKAKPANTEDSTFRLFGLGWTGASRAVIADAVRELRSRQRADGGWAQMTTMQSDAYSTGEALVALHEAGVPVSDPAWQKGVQYLLSTQNADGSWQVPTRMISPAAVSPPFFETGYPFGHDQFISAAAASYATMALMYMLPKAARPSMPLPLSLEPKDEQPWMRTAMFGSDADLRKLLDGGLDPNSHTATGTTVLMMAAPNEAKMRLLLDRGAAVNARSKSGYTALMVTSLYRGSTPALQLLLSKGATADRICHVPNQGSMR